MTFSPAQLERFDSLAIALIEGRLERRQLAELEQSLATEPELADRYLEHLLLHGQLAWQSGAGHVAETASFGGSAGAGSPGHVEPAGRGWLGHAWLATREFVIQPMFLAMLVSSLFITSFLLTLALITLPQTQRELSRENFTSADFVARISGTHDARFRGVDYQLRDDLAAGESLVLESGFAELRFDSGAVLLLTGPAEVVPLADGRCRLIAGELTARVPKQAVGFVVDTPRLSIVDLGTEFGARVATDGETQVEVFDGAVTVEQIAVEQLDGASTEPIRLQAGQAVRLPAAGGTGARLQRVEVGSKKFARWLPGREPVELRPHADDEAPQVAVLYHLDGNGRDSSGNGLHAEPHGEVFQGDAGPPGLDKAAGPFLLTQRLRRTLSEAEAARFNVETFTIEAWVRDPDFSRESPGVFQVRDELNSRVSLRLDHGCISLALQRADSGEFAVLRSEPLTWRPGVWYHVAVTYDGDGQGNDSRVRFYRKPWGSRAPIQLGELKDGLDLAPLTAGALLRIGGLDDMEQRSFGGYIDEIRYTNRALTIDEISPKQHQPSQ